MLPDLVFLSFLAS